jgi:hypothetical protein
MPYAPCTVTMPHHDRRLSRRRAARTPARCLMPCHPHCTVHMYRNGEVVSVTTSGTTVVAQIKMTAEPFTDGTDKKCHMQWFYFK